VTPVNVDISQRHLNESEEAIAVNPTNPDNIVTVTNVGHGEAGLTAGMFEGVSFDGGQTWTTKLIALGGSDPLGDGCCDPSLSFDSHGNLFMTYLYETEDQVPVALSTDGGLTFHVIANISKADLPGKKAGGDNRGLFRFVDQPTITAAQGEVWLVFNAGGPMAATGAPVTGLGRVGAFHPIEVVPGTNNCTYGDVAIGPSGQVMQACNLTESGQGGGKIFVSVAWTGSARPGSGTASSSRRPMSAGSTSSRRSRIARSMPRSGWPGTAPAARATGASTWCIRGSTRTRATTPTSTCGTPTTTAPRGARRCG
jgi:hypothetical protein